MPHGHIKMSYEEMYHAMYIAYHEAAESNQVLIADVGKAFYERSRKQNLYAEDGYHPNEDGSRIAAGVLADIIMG